jgi:hypothetical protein
MYERRWPLIAAALVGVIVVGAIGWAIGRTTAPDEPTQASGAPIAAIRVLDGVPIGIEHSRAGALAAADNYVAVGAETVVQDSARYEQLVRQTYADGYQGTALRDGSEARNAAHQSVDLYAAGGKSVAVTAARRLDSYEQGHAKITTWVAGITWGPGRVPGHTWSLVESRLAWTGDRWRVQKLDVAKRPAPAPQRLGYRSAEQLKTSTFERELRGMTAPIYGGA